MTNDYAVYYKKKNRNRLDAKIRFLKCYSGAFRSVRVHSLKRNLIYFLN